MGRAVLLFVGLAGCGLNDVVRYASHDYTSMVGTETFELVDVELLDDGSTQSFQCTVEWQLTAEPKDIPDFCEDCEFVFAVRLSRTSGDSTSESGLCGGLLGDGRAEMSYNYAYDRRGGYMMVYYGGDYIEWSQATFEGDTLSYRYGVRDVDASPYGYPGYVFTYYWTGQATVE
ncbi:MAG: hypothetical protein AAFV53_29480 [Myxococcota bacterium]